MPTMAREYIDFWIQNSVHAAEEYGTPGASQDISELVGRLVESAQSQGITRDALESEVGDLPAYIRGKLSTVNLVERNRLK